ncbi:MAG: hypothetical protein ACK4SY_10750, partial [Pyrobaculum sp.]
MYRVARELSLHFSHVYRKAQRLESLGFLERVVDSRRVLYGVTTYGLLYSYLDGCGGEVAVAKIGKRLGLEGFLLEEIEAFLKFYLSIADRDAPISGVLTMTSYILERCGEGLCMEKPEAALASRVVAFGIIQMVKKWFGNTIIITDDRYFTIIDKKGKIVATQCKLCEREKYCTTPCPTLTQTIEPKI